MSDPPRSDPAGFGLWDWAIHVYRADGVADACLSLQDASGQNVPLLLWAGWTAASGRPLDTDTIEAACDSARAWETSAVGPLRAVRQALKGPIPDMENAARLALREQIKAVELAAERYLLEGLEALAREPNGSDVPTLDALVAVARSWSRIVPRPGLTLLAERLPA